MRVYRSNRAEILLEALAGAIGAGDGDPFAPVTVVVQSQGMATWLCLELAGKFGVWTLPDFPFPRQMVQRILQMALGTEEAGQLELFSRDRLAFLLAARLPGLIGAEVFSPVRRYLEAEEGEAHLLRICARIAAVFDQYAVYRPEMLRAWEAGNAADLHPADRWQAVLWQQLVQEGVLISLPRLFQQALLALEQPALEPRIPLPDRLFMFGIASLPPVYLRLVNAFARHVAVHLFVLAPTGHYWGDIASGREQARQLAARPAADEEGLHFETGNHLLASLGGLGRDFCRLLEETADYVEPAGDLFADRPWGSGMLAVLQHDILHLIERGAAGAEHPPLPLRPDDDSIVISACHSPLRELEVLHDRLLHLFSQGDDIQPQDVVVMLPDVEAYASLIDAVFDREPADPRFIPYRIADRAAHLSLPLIGVFLRLLAMPAGRLTAPEVMDLLTAKSVAQRFGICAAELDQLRAWVAESGIRWAIDERHRERHGQPRDRQNTWAFGIDRLVLGYAMPSGPDRLFCGLLPGAAVEGEDGRLLGNFVRCTETLFAWIDRASRPMSLSGWRTAVAALLAEFFHEDAETGWQLQKIRDAIAGLAGDAEAVGYTGEVDALALRSLLVDRLEATAGGAGFLAGGVTFCAMLPMRSIPFKVVCLLGMNDGGFPRAEPISSFDLLGRHPVIGDRSRRLDDLYLFLEALLAARSKFYVSYLGRRISDNRVMPPSTVVDLLLDTIRASFFLPGHENEEELALADRGPVEERLVVTQPLQPFSPRYFDGSDPQLFSFAAHYCTAAQAARAAGTAETRRFLDSAGGGAAVPAEIPATAGVISLEDLKRFFRSPSRWYLQRRLGIYFDEFDDLLADREPIDLQGLELFALRRDLLGAAWTDSDPETAARFLKGCGRLPLGRAGEAVCRQAAALVLPVVEAVRALPAGEKISDVALTVDLGDGWSISGEIRDGHRNGLVRARAAKVKEGFLFDGWLDHLFAAAAFPEKGWTTWLVGLDNGRASIRVLRPAAEAARDLRGLVELFRLGQRQPLPFFPKSALAFAEKSRGTGKEPENRRSAARTTARKVFHGDGHGFGPSAEGNCPYVRQVFAGLDPLAATSADSGQDGGHAFEALALRIVDPLLDHLEEA